jgi:hypothetical protein
MSTFVASFDFPCVPPPAPTQLLRRLAQSLSIAVDDVRYVDLQPARNERVTVRITGQPSATDDALHGDSIAALQLATSQSTACTASTSERVLVLRSNGFGQPVHHLTKALDACDTVIERLANSIEYGTVLDNLTRPSSPRRTYHNGESGNGWTGGPSSPTGKATTTTSPSGSPAARPPVTSRSDVAAMLLAELELNVAVTLEGRIAEARHTADRLQRLIDEKKAAAPAAETLRQQTVAESRRREAIEQLTRDCDQRSNKYLQDMASDVNETDFGRLQEALRAARARHSTLSRECALLAKEQRELDNGATSQGVTLRNQVDLVRATIQSERQRYVKLGGADITSSAIMSAFCDEILLTADGSAAADGDTGRFAMSYSL